MKQHTKSFGLCALIVALAASATGSAALAETCSDVKYRLWQKDQVTWYDYGETVEITAGEEGHLYLHVHGKGSVPYSASADIGYPSSFGMGGDSHQVRKHVRMDAQSADDRRAGRVQFVAEAPGTVYLGYNIVSIKTPGDLKDLAAECRLDKVAIRVLEVETQVVDEEPVVTGGDAAQTVVELLYRALLRRERHGGDPQSFVDLVARQGRRGIEDVAEQMMTSEEFRRQALDRTQTQRAGRSQDLAELREWLLRDIYRDLYGLLEPTGREIDNDLRNIDVCLSSDRRYREACAQLSSDLVSSRLFYEAHGDTLRELDGRFGRDDRRGRDRFRRP